MPALCSGSSRVHRLDPRAKLVTCLLSAAAAFASVPPWGLAGTWLVLAFGLWASGLSGVLLARGALRHGRLLVAVALLGALGGAGGMGPSPAGWREGLLLAARLAASLGFSALLVWTTPPAELLWALDRLLSPLRRFGASAVDEFSVALLVALRFFPLLREEVQRLDRAARARGFEPRGGPFRRLSSVGRLLGPLCRRLVQRADGLGRALESRGYGPGSRSTSLRARPFGRAEVAAVGVGLSCLLATAVAPRWI